MFFLCPLWAVTFPPQTVHSLCEYSLLIRKNAWRIQANALGVLSERAKRRAEELANDADIRVMLANSYALLTAGG